MNELTKLGLCLFIFLTMSILAQQPDKKDIGKGCKLYSNKNIF